MVCQRGVGTMLVSKKNNGSFNNEIDYFFNGFDYSSINGFYWLNFYSTDNLKSPKNLQIFASYENYNLEYAYNKNTNEVVLWHASNSVEMGMFCSSTPAKFFTSMNVVIEVKMKMCEENTFDLDEEYLVRKYEECMLINDNSSECSEFYKLIIGVD